jgi:hypothetical protein
VPDRPARCEKTDLLVESCGHCTGAEARARQQEAREAAAGLGVRVEAQYEGACSGCGDRIVPGDTIRPDGRRECGGLP